MSDADGSRPPTEKAGECIGQGPLLESSWDVKVQTRRQRQAIQRMAKSVGLKESAWVRAVVIEVLKAHLPEDAVPLPKKPGHITARLSADQRAALEAWAMGRNGGLSAMLFEVAHRAGWTAESDPEYTPPWRRERKPRRKKK